MEDLTDLSPYYDAMLSDFDNCFFFYVRGKFKKLHEYTIDKFGKGKININIINNNN